MLHRSPARGPDGQHPLPFHSGQKRPADVRPPLQPQPRNVSVGMIAFICSRTEGGRCVDEVLAEAPEADWLDERELLSFPEMTPMTTIPAIRPPAIFQRVFIRTVSLTTGVNSGISWLVVVSDYPRMTNGASARLFCRAWVEPHYEQAPPPDALI